MKLRKANENETRNEEGGKKKCWWWQRMEAEIFPIFPMRWPGFRENQEKSERVIFIRSGIYEERVEIRTPYLTLIGENAETTKITGHLYAKMPMEDIGKLGTFRTYTVFVDTHDFTACNLTFENTAGTGDHLGQAVALYADGDRLLFENCKLLGCTDTLFTGPLPPYELKKFGFTGPKQFAERDQWKTALSELLHRRGCGFYFWKCNGIFRTM